MKSPPTRPVVLLAATVCALALLANPALAITWNVPSVECPTIQAGIDSAAAGDTVLVGSGTYYEHDIVMKSGITLLADQGVVIDAQRLGRVMECYGVDDSTLIQGFIMTGGYRIGFSPENYGGGVLCYGSSLVLSECSFRANEAQDYGGGVGAIYGSPSLLYCAFSLNSAGYGGGALMCCDTEATSTVTRTAFQNNIAQSGGGVFCVYSGTVFSHCTFLENSSVGGFGAAAAFVDTDGTRIRHCTFVRNCGGSAQIVVRDQFFTFGLENTIIAFASQGSSIRFIPWTQYPVITLTCCNIFGNPGGDWTDWEIRAQAGINGNFSDWPRFCDPENNDLSLAGDSPCLAGNHPYGYGCGEFIGALGQGCGPVALTPQTWARVKARYR